MNTISNTQKAFIALADGTVLAGQAVGHIGETAGELCFNTSMMGYQEIFTDPSYYGQVMMMTYPHIGNYGVSQEDMEAGRPMIRGLVVKSFTNNYSNALADGSLDDFLKEHELVGISGIDTRFLVRHIREKGVMNAVISSTDLDTDSLIAKAKTVPSMEGLTLANDVTCAEPYDYYAGGASAPRIAVYDFGVKQNILRSFKHRGCSVRVFPAQTPLDTLLAWKPDGIFLSNGPGDPRAMPVAFKNVKKATTLNIPMFGICLGHQLMALSQGLDVHKMYVGHRGANHPVKNLITGKVEITTQNHGFAVKSDTINIDKAEVTHVNLNDDTLEGLKFKAFPGFSVQYHPEASPGPHDSRYLFDQFLDLMAN